jgi:kynurenine formamidase
MEPGHVLILFLPCGIIQSVGFPYRLLCRRRQGASHGVFKQANKGTARIYWQDRRKEQMMSRTFIDLSIAIQNNDISDSPLTRPGVTYVNHQESLPDMLKIFPGLTRDELPDGAAWAVERVELTTHSGTHLDTPYHYHPTMDKGKPASTIDQVPLEWCFQQGVKLDFRQFPDGYVVKASDVQAELDRIHHVLKPLEIVLVNTRAGSRYGYEDYINTGCGMGYEATMYLLERGVRLVGTDAWGWDAPFVYMAEKYRQTKDASIIWEGHKAGREIGYCQLEKLHNLEVLPADGFTVVCFPTKILAASAGWTRAVAIIEDSD